MATAGNRSVIVVGTDGSEGSIQALRWAMRQAQATHAEVRVVMAWEVSAPLGFVASVDDVDWDGMLGDAIEAAKAAEPELSVPISTQVIRGNPSNALVEASRAADLLVVGSRGHGGVLGRVLGSVSDHCTHHAHCPVLVVRCPAEPPAAPLQSDSDGQPIVLE